MACAGLSCFVLVCGGLCWFVLFFCVLCCFVFCTVLWWFVPVVLFCVCFVLLCAGLCWLVYVSRVHARLCWFVPGLYWFALFLFYDCVLICAGLC